MPHKRKKEFSYTKHASQNYAERRGWTRSTIEDTILNAKKLELSRESDTPYQLAIVYHHPTIPNQYVVRTMRGDLLQVSDLNRMIGGRTTGEKSFYIQIKKRDKNVKSD